MYASMIVEVVVIVSMIVLVSIGPHLPFSASGGFVFTIVASLVTRLTKSIAARSFDGL